MSGTTDLDKARADMIVDCIEDVHKPIAGLFSDQLDEAQKVELKLRAAGISDNILGTLIVVMFCIIIKHLSCQTSRQ